MNITPETFKFLEENIKGKHLCLGLGNDFLYIIPKTKAKKKKKWGYNKTIVQAALEN